MEDSASSSPSSGPAGWDAARAEALATQLAGYPGPAFRRAYFEGLLGSGKSLLAAGNARSAAYCLDKVEAGLQAALAADALAAAESARAKAAAEAAAVDSGEDSDEAMDDSGTAPSGGSAATDSGKPRRPRAPRKPRTAGKSALERLRADWREERLRKAQEILARHGSRLTALERKAYQETLAKWNKAVQDAAGSPAASSAARRADHALLDLRRRLYGRILKSQKAHLIRLSRPTGSLAVVHVHEQFSGPIGPYNDRQNLEGVLTLLAGSDPAWVEEFLELYKGLSDLKALTPSLRPDRT